MGERLRRRRIDRKPRAGVLMWIALGAPVLVISAITGEHTLGEVVLEVLAVPAVLVCYVFLVDAATSLREANVDHQIDLLVFCSLFSGALILAWLSIEVLGQTADKFVFTLSGGIATAGVLREAEFHLRSTPDEQIARRMFWTRITGRWLERVPPVTASPPVTATPFPDPGRDQRKSDGWDALRAQRIGPFTPTGAAGAEATREILRRILRDGSATPELIDELRADAERAYGPKFWEDLVFEAPPSDGEQTGPR